MTLVCVGSIKDGEFIDQLRDYQLLKKHMIHGVRMERVQRHGS
jgi:hypothetical protein